MAFIGFVRRFRRAETLRGGPLRAALRALLSEDYEEAEAALTGLVREDSRDVDAYLGLATLYRRRGEVGRAIQVHQNLLLRADLSHDSRIESLVGLANDFRQGGFLRRAVAAYEEVLVLDSRQIDSLRGLLAVLVDLGEYEQALAIQNRLARSETSADPDAEAALWVRMAEVAHAEGETDRARKCLKRALRKHPDSVAARTLLGEFEAQRGKSKAALAAWRQVAEVGGPGSAAVYPKLAAAFAALDRSRECEGFLRKLVGERPDDSALAMALARTLAQRGDTQAAIGAIRSLLESNPQDLAARIALGQLLLSDSSGLGEAEATKEYGELLSMLEKHRDLTPLERLE